MVTLSNHRVKSSSLAAGGEISDRSRLMCVTCYNYSVLGVYVYQGVHQLLTISDKTTVTWLLCLKLSYKLV